MLTIIILVRKPASIIGRSGPQNLADAKDATPGKCDPKPVCITNPLTSNLKSNDEIAYPPCINIHRCDGCCPANEICMPIKSEDLHLKNVAVISLQNGKVSGEIGDIITVTNHTECECQCKYKSDEDCQSIHPNFVKHPDACECVCSNELNCNSLHYFDRESCSCKCHVKFTHSERNCRARGFVWNEHYCK